MAEIEEPRSGTWRGRPLRFTLRVEAVEDGAFRAWALWADNDDVITECLANAPADALAGVSAALVSVTQRMEMAAGLNRAVQSMASDDAAPEAHSGPRND
jgi:hypothetical protein